MFITSSIMWNCFPIPTHKHGKWDSMGILNTPMNFASVNAWFCASHGLFKVNTCPIKCKTKTFFLHVCMQYIINTPCIF